jgi:hypothetical protein
MFGLVASVVVALPLPMLNLNAIDTHPAPQCSNPPPRVYNSSTPPTLLDLSNKKKEFTVKNGSVYMSDFIIYRNGHKFICKGMLL